VKKIIHILAICFVILAVFACTLPSTLEVRGTPEMEIYGTGNYGQQFEEMFSEIRKSFEEQDVEGFQFFECNNTQYMAFILYLPLIKEDELAEINDKLKDPTLLGDMENELGLSVPDSLLPDEFILGHDYELATGNAKDIKLAEFPDFMKDFEFSGINAKIYVHGTDIVESLGIDVYLDDITFGAPPNIIPPGTQDPDVEISGPTDPFNFDDNIKNIGGINYYTKSSLPNGGHSVSVQDIINNGENVQFSYRAYLKKDNKFKKEWLEDDADIHVQAELVIMLPLLLKVKNQNGATINFPKDFGDKDIFGRDEGENADNSLYESILELTLKMTNATNLPLLGWKLIINNSEGKPSFHKEITIYHEKLEFIFSEDEMKKINKEVIPFIPDISILVPPNATLGIPRIPTFFLKSLYFKAKISYQMDLPF